MRFLLPARSWRLAALPLVLALVVPLVSAQPAQAAGCPASGGGRMPSATPTPGDFAFTGHGWGHGVGMSQYGAQGAARLGCQAGQILRTYFPGTSVASTKRSPTIVAGVAPNEPGARLPRRYRLAHLSGRPVTWQVVRGSVRKTLRRRQRAGQTWTVTSRAGGRFTVHRGDRLIWRGGRAGSRLVARINGRVVRLVEKQVRYRWGEVRFTSRADGNRGFYVTVALPSIERYLRGLAEVPVSWPGQALAAQAIVARSYATLARTSGSRWSACRCHVYDSVYDQVYRGYEVEAITSGGRRWVAAVNGTAKRVLRYGRRVVRGYYSSSHGGFSASSRAVWGGNVAYLRSVDDRAWTRASDDPNKTWTATFSARELGRRLGVGVATAVLLPKPQEAGGRVGNPTSGFGGMVVEGTRGTRRVSGETARSLLGLKSSRFNVATTAAPVTGDWDGDGDDDPGWRRGDTFSLRVNRRVRRVRLGRPGDTPLVGDWNGDGKDSVGVRRGNAWILRDRLFSGGVRRSFSWGASRDRPVIGDWNSDGKDTIGLWRKGLWLLRNVNRGGRAHHRFRWGRAGHRPLVGDWNGDGRDTVGLRRGTRFLLRNRLVAGQPALRYDFGAPADAPITGAWRQGRVDTVGVVRGGLWSLRTRHASGRADRRWDFRG